MPLSAGRSGLAESMKSRISSLSRDTSNELPSRPHMLKVLVICLPLLALDQFYKNEGLWKLPGLILDVLLNWTTGHTSLVEERIYTRIPYRDDVLSVLSFLSSRYFSLITICWSSISMLEPVRQVPLNHKADRHIRNTGQHPVPVVHALALRLDFPWRIRSAEVWRVGFRMKSKMKMKCIKQRTYPLSPSCFFGHSPKTPRICNIRQTYSLERLKTTTGISLK